MHLVDSDLSKIQKSLDLLSDVTDKFDSYEKTCRTSNASSNFMLFLDSLIKYCRKDHKTVNQIGA